MTRPHRLWIAAILFAALVVRAVAFSPYAVHHPDEAIQYLEQAYRLLHGHGLVPWEYRLGMRSWLVPVLLAGPMWLGDVLAPGTALYVILPRLAFAAIALAPLWAAWSIGRQVSERHALFALGVVALWHEWVYFSLHVLTETLSVALLLPAAALLLGERTRTRLAAAGVLLGFACIFRFQFAPAAAVLVAMVLKARWRDWGWLILGGLVPAIASSGVDLAMRQWPFAWIVENIRLNVVQNRAAEFGVFGLEAYAQMVWLAWAVATVPILWCAWPAARRFSALAVAAVVNLAVHLAIGHKEYRFILLSTQLVILLAAIGTVDRIASVRRERQRVALFAAAAAWAVSSLLLALSALTEPGWRRHGSGYQLAHLAAQRGICGVAIFGGDYWPPLGQLWLRGPTPQYYFLGPDPATQRALVARTSPAFDATIAPPGWFSVPGTYAPVSCAGDGRERLCLSVRAGGCIRDAIADRQLMQRVLERNGR